MPYRWICLRLLFLLVLLFGGLGTLRAEVSKPDSLSAERSFGLVRFRSSAQARYALDLGDESWYLGSMKMDSFYREFATEYTAPWKLIPTGERDVVEAYYEGSKGIDLSRVRFASTPDSPALPADYDEARKAWTLALPATESNSTYEVFALYQGKVIGKLCVVSYPKQSYKLRLVPVNGQSLGDVSRLSQQLNSIYNKYGVSFTLYEGEGVSSELKAKSLSQDLRKLQDDYEAQHSLSDNEVCIFILSAELSKGSKYEELEGLMPRGKRFGYIFAGNSPNEEELARTLAHELGHGLFTLQHTFDDEYGGKNSKGKTQNLMDYTEGATELAAFQWNVMANTAPFTALDREKEIQSHQTRLKKLLDWIRNNRQKAEVRYNKYDYYLSSAWVEVAQQLQVARDKSIWVYVELGDSGLLDLSSNEKNVAKAVHFSMDLERKFHTGFYLAFSYANAPSKTAIKLWCYRYEDFKLLLDYIGYGDIPREYTIGLYKSALERVGTDCNRLDVIYETMPPFVGEALDDRTLIQHLNLLAECTISNDAVRLLLGWGYDTDEEQAILNIISHIKDKDLLYRTLQEQPHLLLKLYKKIDGEDNRRILLNEVLKACTQYWEQTREDLGKYYKPENILFLVKDTQIYGSLNNERVELWCHGFSGTPLTQVTSLTPKSTHTLLSPVYIAFSQEANVRDNQYSVIPAIYAYYLAEIEQAKDTEAAINWVLSSIGVYGSTYTLLNSTGKIARAIAWSALLNDATRLFFEDSKLKAYIETQPWGEDFIKAYYAISIGIDAANITQGALHAIRNNSNKVRSVLIQNKVTQRELELFDATINKVLVGSVSKVGKYSLAKISQEQGFIDLLPGLLKKEGLTMDDFHYMMQKSVEALTDTEKVKLIRIRSALPKPNANTLMQKVIPKQAIDAYLRVNEPYTTIVGHVTIAADAKHLRTYDDLYYGLRLDYLNDGGKLMNFVEDGSCGVIRFKASSANEFVIPGEEFMGSNEYPYTAHGFTSGNNGRLGAPEWHIGKGQHATIEDGAELWEVYSNGQEVLRAVFKNNKFHAIK